MKMLIDPVFDFIAQLTFWKIVAYFWPFFFIDIVRYVLSDLVILVYHIPKRIKEKALRTKACRLGYKYSPLAYFDANDLVR